jgi:hypothetical protein
MRSNVFGQAQRLSRGGPIIVIDVVEQPTETRAPSHAPSGWYDPDSSAFEPMVGAAAVSDAMAGSLDSDRSLDAADEETDSDDR